MAVVVPDLLEIGADEIGADECRDEFNQLLTDRCLVDPLGNRISFDPEDDWHHVCYKEPPDERNGPKRGRRTVWEPSRAMRIPWIPLALTHPETEIRMSTESDFRYAYILQVADDAARQFHREFFGAITQQTGERKVVRFVTAFPLDHITVSRWRTGGKCLYPIPEQKRKKKKGRR